MTRYMNATNGAYIRPFEVEKVLENGQIWVREIHHDYNEVTGEGTVEIGRLHRTRVLLTQAGDGSYFSKTNPLHRGYKFEFADEPKAWANPKTLRFDRAYQRAVLFSALV